jgi:hypothetical protein
MTRTDSGRSIGQLILVPALITLAVTILRFVGEIKHWSPNWFNHQMGLSVVAIVWLAPFFGVYFALRLRSLAQQPVSAWRALGLAVLAALIVLFLPGLLPFRFVFPGRLLYGWSFLVLAAAVTLPGWPALFKTLLAYAYAARIPIAILMFFAMRHNLGTHYDAVPRDLPAGIGFWPKYLWLAFFAQLVYWVAITIVMGMLFGTFAAGVARIVRGPARASSSPV